MGIILTGLILLVFLLFRGCQLAKHKVAENTVLKEALDSIVIKNERDSMASIQRDKDYSDSLQFVNGILDLKQIKLEATEERLLATANNASYWKQKCQSVQPDMDTSVTMVPNLFIQDCHQCFDDLEHKDRLVKLYVREVREVDSTHKVKEKIQQNRIRQLTSERNTFQQNANDAIEIAGKAQTALNALRPRGVVYLKLATIAIDRYYPSGVGGGLTYKDKRNRLYGVKAYATNVGAVYEAELGLPLSFKRKP